jgi:hypothetical protein
VKVEAVAAAVEGSDVPATTKPKGKKARRVVVISTSVKVEEGQEGGETKANASNGGGGGGSGAMVDVKEEAGVAGGAGGGAVGGAGRSLDCSLDALLAPLQGWKANPFDEGGGANESFAHFFPDTGQALRSPPDLARIIDARKHAWLQVTCTEGRTELLV